MSNQAYFYIVRLLSMRDYSEHKLKTKLREKKFTTDEIENALTEIKAKGYLRENAYIESRIKGFMHKYCSINYIKQKLQQEKLNVSEEVISDIFDEHQITENDQIRYLLTKKLKSANTENIEDWLKAKQKAMRYALSKGHNISLTIKILKEFKNKNLSLNDHLDEPLT